MSIAAPLHLHVATSPKEGDTGLPSPPQVSPSPRSADATCSFQNDGRPVDGGMAVADDGDGGGGARDDARAERVRAHRSALGHRLLPASPLHLSQRRLCDAENRAAGAAHRAQPDPLQRPARLVLRADPDPDRTGGSDRVHDADLDRDPGCGLSGRAHHRLAGDRDHARRYRCGDDRSSRDRRGQSGTIDRTRRCGRIWNLHDAGEVADADRKCARGDLLDDRGAIFRRIYSRRSTSGCGHRPMRGAG